MYVSYSSIKNVTYIRKKAKSKYKYFYISKQKNTEKKFVNKITLKKKTLKRVIYTVGK